jgi:hypothetical protein
MHTDMVSEVLAICLLFRRIGAQNKGSAEIVGQVFECQPNVPMFFHLVAGVISQFELLRKQILESKRFSEEEQKSAILQLDAISRFLQPHRLVRPWPEVLADSFKEENFAFRFMRSPIAQDFPMRSLSPEEVEELIPKLRDAIAEIKRGGDVPEIVVQILTGALGTIEHILTHFRFYGVETLEEKIAAAFTVAKSVERRAIDHPTRRAFARTLLALAVVSDALVRSNDVVHAVEDWEVRGDSVLKYVSTEGNKSLLQLPKPDEPQAGSIEEPPRNDGVEEE